MAYPRSLLPAVSGLSRRQIRHLAERQLVVPSTRGPRGRGSATLYNREDVLKLTVLGAVAGLIRGELGGEIASAVIRALSPPPPSAGMALIVDAESAWIAAIDELPGLVRTLPAAAWVSLELAQARVDRELSRHFGTALAA